MTSALAGVPWLVMGLIPMPVRIQIVLGVVSFLVLISAVLLLATNTPEGRNGITRWRIGPWYLIWSGVIFGLATLQWINPDQTTHVRAVGMIDLASIVGALGVVTAGYAAWGTGYWFGVPHFVVKLARSARRALVGSPRAVLRGPSMPWVLYGLGSAGYLTNFVATGRFGYVGDPSDSVSHALPTSQAVYVVSLLTMVAVGAAAFRAFDPMIRGGRATLVALVTVETAAGMLRGSKEAFFLTMIAVLIPYGAVRGRLPKRMVVGAALVLILVAVPFNAAYRDTVRTATNSGVRATPLSDAVNKAPQVLTDAVRSDSTREQSHDSFLFRVRLIDSVAIIWQRTPSQIPYRDPTQFLVAPFVGLVPRAVWPNKPIKTPGYDFAQEYYNQPSWIYSAGAVTPIGDLYRHGGWLVLIAGMLVLGMGYRLFDTLFRPDQDPRAMCFLLVLFPTLIKSELDFYGILLAIPTALAAGALGARLMCRSVPVVEQQTASDPTESAAVAGTGPSAPGAGPMILPRGRVRACR